MYNWLIKFSQSWNLNRKSLVSEVTALPTEPPPLPCRCLFKIKNPLNLVARWHPKKLEWSFEKQILVLSPFKDSLRRRERNNHENSLLWNSNFSEDTISLSISLSFQLCLTLPLSASLCLYISRSVPLYLFDCLYLSLSLSLSIMQKWENIWS